MDSYRRQNPYLEPREPRFLSTLLGPLQLVSPAAGQILTLNELKTQLRVDPDITADDNLISGLLNAAQEYVSKRVQGHRQLLSAVYNVPVVCWWGGWVGGFPGFWGSNYGVNSGDGTLELPLPPLQQVVSITYYDTNGAVQTLDPTFYIVRLGMRGPGEIDLAPFQIWPALQPLRKYPITVQIVAGYATQVSASLSASTFTVVGSITYTAGTQILLDSSGGNLPGGLSTLTPYYVVNPTNGGSTFQVSATSGGSAITFTSNPTGNCYVCLPQVGPLRPVWKRACMLVVSHWYRNREPGTLDDDVETALSNLLAEEGWGSYA